MNQKLPSEKTTPRGVLPCGVCGSSRAARSMASTHGLGYVKATRNLTSAGLNNFGGLHQ
jgi:hypothetical protein